MSKLCCHAYARRSAVYSTQSFNVQSLYAWTNALWGEILPHTQTHTSPSERVTKRLLCYWSQLALFTGFIPSLWLLNISLLSSKPGNPGLPCECVGMKVVFFEQIENVCESSLQAACDVAACIRSTGTCCQQSTGCFLHVCAIFLFFKCFIQQNTFTHCLMFAVLAQWK